jgi:hypothetical protein
VFDAHRKLQIICTNPECRRQFNLNNIADKVKQKNNKKFENSIKDEDYVECLYCGLKARDLTKHIFNIHKIPVCEYTGKTRCDNYLNKQSERIRGNKNPAYNHGGKLSPFSKKFIYADTVDLSSIYNVGSISSKIERQFSRRLSSVLPNIQKQFFLKIDTGFFIYDIKYCNKIIEFNGDYWHMNPNKYPAKTIFRHISKSDEVILAEDVWKKDKVKIQVAKTNGYEVMIVWEHDYRKNKEETIKKCLNFLTA